MMYNDDKQFGNSKPSMADRGQLITFEGIDGSGKSTQAILVADWLREHQVPVLALREPGGTAIGESIRTILLAKANTAMCMETELLLFSAARAQIVREVIGPALSQGTWVILDRFYDSTTAYQGYGRGIDRAMIRHLQEIATGGLCPDKTFLLDVTIPVALRRLAGRPGKADRLDGEDIDFMVRTRGGYHDILREEPDRMIRIDADQTEVEIKEQIIRHLKGDLNL